MSWVSQTIKSSVGGKALMAVTGLAITGFVVAHLAGNLLIYAGADALNAYAMGMTKLGGLLWVLRIGLATMFVIHIALALKLTAENRRARPIKYAYNATVQASFASRYMIHTGLVLLAFLLFHLAHFTLKITDPAYAALGPEQCYQMVVMGFSNPLISAAYIVSMLCLGLHLWHGVSSLWQSLGINHARYNPLLRVLGPLAGLALAGGNISIPVSVMLGIIK